MSTLVITPITARPIVARRAPARPAARPVGRGDVRLTARGRAVVLLVGLVLVLAAAVFLGASSVATDAPEQTRVVTVGSGDTLWGLAADLTEGDVRDMVAHIQELNDLDGATLELGQQLRVPVSQG